MNNTRRKALREAVKMLYEAHSIIESCLDDECEAVGNLPDSIYNSKRGDVMESNVQAMDLAVGDIESAIDDLTDIDM